MKKAKRKYMLRRCQVLVASLEFPTYKLMEESYKALRERIWSSRRASVGEMLDYLHMKANAFHYQFGWTKLPEHPPVFNTGDGYVLMISFLIEYLGDCEKPL